jgi:hypothetical protein
LIAPSRGAGFEAGKDTRFVHDGRYEGGGQGGNGQGELGTEVRSLEEVVDVGLASQRRVKHILARWRSDEPTYPDNRVVVLAQETQDVIRRREQHARRRHPKHLERRHLLGAEALLHEVEHLAGCP